MKIGVVTSRFNEEITGQLHEGAISYLEEIECDIYAVFVPGAVEIPLACKALLEKGCDGVIALGCVIRGETSHYDYVCNSVERGITELMLTTGKPVSFGVLTTENEEQAFERVGGKHGHKGVEAAQVVIEMIGLLKDIREFRPESSGKAAKSKAVKSSSKKPAKKSPKKVTKAKTSK